MNATCQYKNNNCKLSIAGHFNSSRVTDTLSSCESVGTPAGGNSWFASVKPIEVSWFLFNSGRNVCKAAPFWCFHYGTAPSFILKNTKIPFSYGNPSRCVCTENTKTPFSYGNPSRCVCCKILFTHTLLLTFLLICQPLSNARSKG